MAREKRPFVLAKKDSITKEWVYVANSVGKDGTSPETSNSQADALKFESVNDASDGLTKLGSAGKGFEIRKI